MIGSILFLIIFFLILIVAIVYFSDRVEKCCELECEIHNLAYSAVKNHLLWLREKDDLGELSDNEFEVELIRNDEMRAVWDSIDHKKILRRAVFSFKPITKENLLTQEQLNLIYGKL